MMGFDSEEYNSLLEKEPDVILKGDDFEKIKREIRAYVSDFIIEDRIIAHSRWSVIHRIVFNHKGTYLCAMYSQGATEMQDESPLEYDTDIGCHKVKLEKVPTWILKEE